MKKEKKKVQTVFWYILLIIALTAFTVHLAKLIQRYISTPVSSQTTKINQTFPEIMICNNFPLSKTAIERVFVSPHQRPPLSYEGTKIAHKLVQYGIIKLGNKKSPGSGAEVLINSANFPKQVYDTLAEIVLCSINQAQLIETFSLKKQTFILDCSYNDNRRCSFDDFEDVYHREFIKCFKFVPPGGNQIDSLQLTLFADLINPTALPSYANFFNVSFVHIHPNGKIIYDISPGANIFIYPKGVHPHSEYRTVISMGMEHNIEVRQQSEELVNTKNAPCLDADKKTTNFSLFTKNENRAMWKEYKYTREDCEYNVLTNHIADVCGCLPQGKLQTAYTHNLPYCCNISAVDRATFLKQLKCYQEEIDRIPSYVCLPTCKRTFYDRYLSSIKWPLDDVVGTVIDFLISQYYKDVNETIRADREALKYFINRRKNIKRLPHYMEKLKMESSFKDNFLKLRLFKRKSLGTLTREYKAYPIENLMSDFGGIIGLYLGISLLAVAELVTFISSFIEVKKKSRNKQKETVREAAPEEEEQRL